MAKHEIATAVAQVEAIALTVTKHVAPGTLSTTHPFTVAILLKAILPHIPEAIMIDIALIVVQNMINGQRNAVVTHFVPDMAQKYTEDTHKASVAGLAKEFGKISDVRLIQATRNYNDVGQYMSDSLLFLGKGSNGKTVAASIMFVPASKKFKIASIAFRPVEIRKLRNMR